MNVGKVLIENFYFDAKNVKMHIIEIKNAWEVLMIFLVIKRFNKKGGNKNEFFGYLFIYYYLSGTGVSKKRR